MLKKIVNVGVICGATILMSANTAMAQEIEPFGPMINTSMMLKFLKFMLYIALAFRGIELIKDIISKFLID